MRLVKSGYYDEKRAEKAAEKTEGGKWHGTDEKAPTKGWVFRKERGFENKSAGRIEKTGTQ